MLPSNTPSDPTVPSRFKGGRGKLAKKFQDFEDGGIAPNDPSAGLEYQVWEGWIEDASRIYVQADNMPEPFLAYTGDGITEVSITFDQNMRLTAAFMEAGVGKLWWFDPTVPGMVIREFPGIRNPKVSLDDKRPIANSAGTSDIILAYVRAGNLYFCLQRERFAVEHLWLEGVNTLYRIGMTEGLRFQFEYR